jgi:thymidylate synthase (FAD)
MADMNDKIDLLDHGFIRLVDHMGSDISVVRAARVSYDAAWRAGEDEGSDARLINYLWKNKHTTPFESVQFTFEVKAPIFNFRQWHRHRTWCLSGDSLISFEHPDRYREGTKCSKKILLSDLARKWNDDKPVKRLDKQKRSLRDWQRSRIKDMILRVYDEENKEFTTGNISDIITSGKKDVFELSLDGGKNLKCTRDHLLFTSEGWKRLEDAIGLVVSSSGLAGMTKECYLMTNGFIEKQEPWNKGVTGYKTKRVVTDIEKDIIRKARSGERSNFWKGGVTPERKNIARWTREQAPVVHKKCDYTCYFCGIRGGELHVHHIKSVVGFPELARNFDNLTSVHKHCHQDHHRQSGEMRMGKGRTLRARKSKVVGIRYVGKEDTYDISVEGPHHNFVANGIIVHNSYNELSARYRELPEEFYLPTPDQLRSQSSKNKQGSEGFIDESVAIMIIDNMKVCCEEAFVTYRQAIKAGVAKELARLILPVNTYSHMFASVNLLNLFRFLTLRDHDHAQYEIRVYAAAMRELIRPIVPVCVKAWESGQG